MEFGNKTNERKTNFQVQGEHPRVYTVQPPDAVGEVLPSFLVTKPVTKPITEPPPDFFWVACFSALFFLPLAAVAVQFSTESERAAKIGDYATARWKGRAALGVAIAGIVLGSATVAVIVVLRVQGDI